VPQSAQHAPVDSPRPAPDPEHRGPPILGTKLAQPRDRKGLIARPRLVRALDGDGCALTLVAAPTGYGKTTAVRYWASHRRDAIAWVTLDPGDNDPVRLWTYLATAIERIRAGLGRAALQRLTAFQGDLRPAVDELINGIAAFGAPIIIVLDDLQAVSDSRAIASLEHLIEWLPANCRVIAISRADPPFPLAPLRARGTLAEVRAAALAFTRDEAMQLLVEQEGNALSVADVERLVERTEGWPAALYLAALMATDGTLREIASGLFVSLNTVKTHARVIYRKLGVQSRADALARAGALGLIEPNADAGVSSG